MNKELKRDLQHKPKEIPITLDKERTFILDLNAYSELDMLYPDKSFNAVMEDFFEQRPYAVRALMWACLVHEDENLTVKDVGGMLNGQGFNKAAEVIMEGLRDDVPSADDNEEAVKKK